ncbi:MAG: hypothetical protein RI964_3246 [Pseudomonadota bacterium]
MENEAIFNRIDARLDRIERLTRKTHRQTLPEMPWLFAAIAGAAVVSLGYVFYPQLPEPIKAEIEPRMDVMQNYLYTVGQTFADYAGNVDRSYTVPSGTLTLVSLSPLQSCRWRSALLTRESSGVYQHPGNRYGYFGGYAFGAEALSIVGLVKQSAFDAAPRYVRNGTDQTAWLNNPNNWRLTGGKQAFLNDNLLQDRAVSVLANENIKGGFNSRVLLESQQEKIAGFAAAAHLKGLTAAISWYGRGQDSHDANGTNTSDYARMGETSINRRSNLCAENTYAVPSWLKWMEGKK